MSGLSRPRRPVLLVLAAVLCLTATSSAQGDRGTVPAKIFVSEKLPAFHGALHSRSRFCSGRRHLLVFRPHPGADSLVARGRTHPDGTWKVALGQKLQVGRYYVVAPPRLDPRHDIRCSAARSKSIPVE